MRLLIIAHLDGHITAAGRIAVARGAKVAHIDNVDGALNALRSGRGADLVMCDIRQDIERLIVSMRDERIATPVVACGVDGDADAAVRAIQAGAKEYVPLPPNADLIAAVLEAVADDHHDVIATDPVMRAVMALADRIAPSDATVLITGESGTGKEVFAQYIHRKSKRAAGTFVSVNCAAIPDNLLESELFGHEKGAFTGAVARRVGKFEEADGGTLLLDEISEMDLRLQAKLLRAIQERTIDRVGGTSPVKVNIRLIATSNRNLEDEVREKRFREDLYFRLNVVNLQLPPLRQRTNDIVPLATYFAKKYADANGLPHRPFAKDTEALLRAHHWRGNVRELENTMHRAVLLASGKDISSDAIILSGHTLLPEGFAPQGAAAPAASGSAQTLVGRTVADVEKDLIIHTLEHCLGNRTHAANILGISIRTLRNKLREYTDAGHAIPTAASEEG